MSIDLPEPNVAVIARKGENILVFVLRDVPEGGAIEVAEAAGAKKGVEYKTCYRCKEIHVVGS